MQATLPDLDTFITHDALDHLIAQAMREDLGDPPRDMTTDLCIEPNLPGDAVLRARQGGVLAGGALLGAIAKRYDPGLKVTTHLSDGSLLDPTHDAAAVIARLQGPLASMLRMERVALNFIIHLSGIASLTRRYVELVQGTNAQICETRKTLPGLRGLQKYAVACGGGVTHRMGLYDAMLIKDNHLAHLPATRLHDKLAELVTRARGQKHPLKFIQVEVDTLDQLKQVLDTGVDMVLLDNMTPSQLREAVAMRDDLSPQVKLEASGNVNLETVRAMAQAGVDRISIGGLTHAAPSLDVGMDIDG